MNLHWYLVAVLLHQNCVWVSNLVAINRNSCNWLNWQNRCLVVLAISAIKADERNLQVVAFIADVVSRMAVLLVN